MKKTSMLLLMLLLAVAVLGGCTTGDSSKEMVDYEAKLYYVHASYIETGDESGGVLYQYGKTISCKEGQQYQAVVDMLKTVPEELEKAETTVNEQIKYHNVYVEKGTAYVDIKSGEVTGGSMEETLYISQIVQSLMDSFSEINQVQFLIDEKVAESIMGHCDITEPYTEGIYTSIK